MNIQLDDQKLYYSISEVSALFDVNTSVIRYWGKEFKQLKPIKNAKGERRYTKKDIDIINKIFVLLRDKGFTIEGAKKELSNTGTLFEEVTPSTNEIIDRLEKIKSTLLDIKTQLE
jgi:DNA-binding transcriptional MerR regulator